MYVCVCNAIPESAVREAMAEGVDTLEGLRARLGVAAGCGSCGITVQTMLGAERRAAPTIYRPGQPVPQRAA